MQSSATSQRDGRPPRMHGRPRDYKNKLKDPKAQEQYKKKVSVGNGQIAGTRAFS